MKLNHVSPQAADVGVARVLFERYLGICSMVEIRADRFVGSTDSTGMLLTISNLDVVSEVVYPKYFAFVSWPPEMRVGESSRC